MRSRGSSLVELLVAMTVLALMGAAVLWIYRVGISAQRKGDAHSDAYRQVMIAGRHIHEQLRCCQLQQPSAPGAPQATVVYRFPRVSNGQVEIDSTGNPMWAGIATLSVDSQGNVVRTDDQGAPAQVLARLGSKGSLEFERLDQRLLKVTLVGYQQAPQGQNGRYEVSFKLSLPNQP